MVHGHAVRREEMPGKRRKGGETYGGKEACMRDMAIAGLAEDDMANRAE